MRALAVAALLLLTALPAHAAPPAWPALLLRTDGSFTLGAVAPDDVACGGFAPVPPLTCVSGPWGSLGDLLVVFAFPVCGSGLGQPQHAGACYVGTMRSDMDDGQHLLHWECNVVLAAGLFLEATCGGGGARPTGPFTERCSSNVIETDLDGGLGDWRCTVKPR